MPDEPASPEPLPLDPPTVLEAHDGSSEEAPFPHETPASSGGTAPPPAAPHALGTIGDFEVVDKLGQGGMGAVYRARQISLGRLVALKILPAQFEEDEDFVSRFQREARLASSLNHPNLVRVYSSGMADGSHFIAMELVEGETLSRRVKRGPLPPADAVRICLDVTRALQCGWQSAQLIHRDIKPSNIYLSHEGEVKLGDLGLAKSLLGNTTGLTHTGAAMGTPHYISPEQARGDKALDFRTDIYSLGCTLYQCLTGRTPYEGSDPLTVMNLHLSGPPPGHDAHRKAQWRNPRFADRFHFERRRIWSFQRKQRGAVPHRISRIPRPPLAQRRERHARRDALRRVPNFHGRSGTRRSASLRGDQGSPVRERPRHAVRPVPIIGPARIATRSVAGGGPTDGQRVLFSVWDMRVQDYEAFVKETKREWLSWDFPHGPTHPAVNVTWDDAQLFCQWLTTREQAAGRLPAEKDGQPDDAFSWGTQCPPRHRERETLPEKNCVLCWRWGNTLSSSRWFLATTRALCIRRRSAASRRTRSGFSI